ncbi:MAG: nucleotidyltransferase domain-containing protein [Spirochaetes bacterium]|nr:nucleotidyltransferase domain-containing protein [Spirochaetota bacterium]
MEKKEYNLYLNEILDKLKELDVFKIILFGSLAINTVKEDRDIDLLIVLNDTNLPDTYEERMNIKLDARKKLREINKEAPIDLLVYTLPQYDIIKKNMNSFFKEIHAHGKVLYEKAS